MRLRSRTWLHLIAGLFLLLLAALSNASGQVIPANPTAVPVTGHFTNNDGTPYAGDVQLRFQLQNCSGAYPRIYAHSAIVLNQYVLRPNASGVVSGTLWPNSYINCGGVTGNTWWLMTRVVNNTPQGVPICWNVSTSGLNLDSDTPCNLFSPGTDPNAPKDGTWNNGTFLGDLDVYGTTRLHGFVHMYQNVQIDGTLTAAAGVFTTLNATNATLTNATIQALTAATLSVTGNGTVGGTLSANYVNAVGGYTYNSGTGVVTGQCLVAGSDAKHTFVPGSCGTAPTLYYQLVKANGASQPQRGALNFGPTLSATDNPGLGATQVDLPSIGTAGTYTFPSQIKLDAQGRVLSITNGSAAATNPTRTCTNSTSCYVIDGNGTITQWLVGATQSDMSGGSGNGPQTLTFPKACPNAVMNVQVTTVAPTLGTDDTHMPNQTAVSWNLTSVTVQRYRLADHGSDASYPSVQVVCY